MSDRDALPVRQRLGDTGRERRIPGDDQVCLNVGQVAQAIQIAQGVIVTDHQLSVAGEETFQALYIRQQLIE